MKRISSLWWLVLGLVLAALLFFSWFWFDQQQRLSESASRVNKAGDAALRIQLLDSLLRNNTALDRQVKAFYVDWKAVSFGQLGMIDSMNQCYRQALALDPGNDQYLNNVAFEWAKRGINLDSAAAYALKAVAMARQRAAQNKPLLVDQQAWDHDNSITMGYYLDTYGWVLYHQQDYAGAVAQLREANKRAPDGNIEYHLGMALYRWHKLDEAVDHLVGSLARNPEQQDSVRLAAEQAYREKNRSLRGFDDLLAKYQDRTRQQQEAKELADGSDYVGRPAPDFTLPDLVGQGRRLADQRGKAVVICFWAMSNNTSTMTLPMIDQVQRRYKDQPVACFAVDLDSRDKVAMVRTYAAEKGYTLAVLQGGRMGNGLDRVYGVTGIPTSFVVDKSGVIRFRHIGYTADLDKLLARELDGLLR